MEERRDVGVTSGPGLIREFNDAVERRDLEAISKRIRPDAVWRHNRGELQAKHRTVTTEIVTPYVQRLELKDGLLARGEMVQGPGVHRMDQRRGWDSNPRGG